MIFKIVSKDLSIGNLKKFFITFVMKQLNRRSLQEQDFPSRVKEDGEHGKQIQKINKCTEKGASFSKLTRTTCTKNQETVTGFYKS